MQLTTFIDKIASPPALKTSMSLHHDAIRIVDTGHRLNPMSSELTLSSPNSPRKKHSAFMRDVVAATVEALGTFLFLFAAFGGVNASQTAAGGDSPGAAGAMMIATSFGLSLLVVAWALYRVSGGLLNPAVTVALVISKAITPRRGAMFVLAQLIGAICAAAMVEALFPGPFTGANSLKNAISVTQAFFLEMILTGLFTLVILMLAVEKSRGTFVAPVGIGLALFLVHLVAVPYTGCSVNPARSLAASIFEGTWSDHWIFWVAPVLGAVLASLFHLGIKTFDYETLNPGQDAQNDGEKQWVTREVEADSDV